MKPARPPILTKSDEAALAEGCYFDRGKAHRTVRWIEKTFNFHFYKWQRHILLMYFGWRKADGSYRFRSIIVFIPKKNGKTTFIAPLVGFKLFELHHARIYSAAHNAEQAKILMDQLIKIFKKSPKIARMMKPRTGKIKAFCSPFRRDMTNEITGTTFKALANNPDGVDGIIPDCLIVDEIHRMKNNLIDIVMGSTTNHLTATIVIISTAGNGDKTHRSWQEYSHAKKVLSGEIIDVSCLPVIYECPDNPQTADEIFDINRLIACNPRLQEDPKALASARQELIKAREQQNYTWWLRFKLNKWIAEDGKLYIDPGSAEFLAAATIIPEEQLREAVRVYVGIDRGQTWDLTAVVLHFYLADGRIYELHFTFAHADRIAEMGEKDGIDYRQFSTTGELELIPSDVVHDEWLTDRIKGILAPYKVTAVAGDPYMASFILESLKQDGREVFSVVQSNNRLLTPVIDDYETLIHQGKLLHKPNRLYEWQLRCCRKAQTSKDTVKIVKANSNVRGDGGIGHIDSIDAAINARAVARADDVKNINYSSGAVVA